MTLTLHQGYQPGCIGKMVALQVRYYSQTVGFGLQFETKIARELCDFCEQYDSQRDGLWLALLEGEIVGSIAIDGSHAAQDGAHLRWFIASDAARGTGVGAALLTCAMQWCQSRHYQRVYLWTFEGLGAARHLYEKFGFRLTHQQRGVQWGSEVNEQKFELQIRDNLKEDLSQL